MLHLPLKYFVNVDKGIDVNYIGVPFTLELDNPIFLEQMNISKKVEKLSFLFF